MAVIQDVIWLDDADPKREALPQDDQRSGIEQEISEIKRRVMVGPGDPGERYPVPAVAQFDEAGADFLPAPDLEAIASAMIERHKTRFVFLRMCRVEYLWRGKGGKSTGKAILGKCSKPSGLTKHYSGATYIIWLAADHARDMGLSRYQVEAMVYHELSHTGCDSESGDFTTFGHDFEGFRGELEYYGFWDETLRGMGEAAIQLGLPGLVAGGH